MKARLAGYAEKTHRRKIPLRRHWVATEEHSFFFFFKDNFYLHIYLFGCCTSQLWYVGSSSLTKDRAWVPALGTWSLSHWTTREVPRRAFSSKEIKPLFLLLMADFFS